jgi:hypothetical protein
MVVLTEHTCLDENQVANYLLRHLDEPEIAAIEEKLLICEHCQEIYSGVEAYVCGMRRAMSTAQKLSSQFSLLRKGAAS